jgi:hypothetical protein
MIKKYTSNGLELTYTGEHPNDFSDETVTDLAVKFNGNMMLLDSTIVKVSDLFNKMQILEERGHIDGIINGGGLDPYITPPTL